MAKVERYCPICDNSGGTHAPCFGCGKYFKTGMILGGISPGTPGAPVVTPKGVDDRIKIKHHVTLPMPDKHSWGLVQDRVSWAICENALYGVSCSRSFTKIAYVSAGEAPVPVYQCTICGSQFFADGLEKVLDEDDVS